MENEKPKKKRDASHLKEYQFKKNDPRTAEIGRKGGAASAVTKKEKKLMEEDLKLILGMAFRAGDVEDLEEIANFDEFKNANITVQQMILLKIVQSALLGDVRAAQYLRDTAGEVPVKKMNVDANIDTSILDDINRQLEG